MLHLLGTSVLLVYIASSHCSTTERPTEHCDPNSCNATCSQQLEGWKDLHGLARCENNECHCYLRSVCDDKACADSCRQRHGNESHLQTKCVNDICTCGWDKQCVLSECKSQCAQNYPANPNFEAYCKGNVCECKWEEVITGPTPTPGLPYVDIGGTKRELILKGHDAFYLEEIHRPHAKSMSS